MIRRFASVGSTIAGLGGPAAVSLLTGMPINTVSMWRVRNKIPPEYFLIFSAAAAKIRRRIEPALFGFADPSKSTGFLAWRRARFLRRFSAVAMRKNKGIQLGQRQCQ